MAHRKTIALLPIVLVVGAASFVMAIGIPDVFQCSAEFPYAPPNSEIVLFNVPNGTGSAFSEARTLEGPVDATIWVTVRDGVGAPIANYPYEDLWLEDENDMLAPCTLGTIADANTDMDGYTEWANPLRAGGWTEEQTLVFINGNGLIIDSPEGTILRHNSPDINGDLLVDLIDLSLFSIDYTGDSFRSDFYYDGIVDLLDLSIFSIGYTASCP